MLLVVATPREWYAVFGGYLAILLAVIRLAGVPVLYVVRRMVIEVPFLVFAAVLPFVATGPRVDVLGLSVSEPGLVAAFGLAAKGSIGVMASLTLAATTEPSDVFLGLRRLRMPELLVQIMGFMVRYLDVVHRRPRPHAHRDALTRLRPTFAAALGSVGPRPRCLVHPRLRAWGARPPRHARAWVRRSRVPRA